MNHWLFKTEPSTYSVEDLMREANQTCTWDGIRNYQARNFIRDQMEVADEILLYHSRCTPTAVVGLAKVVRSAYPDPAQFDHTSPYYDAKSPADNPRWLCVDIQFMNKFITPVTLEVIKKTNVLNDMVLVKQGRLSIQPVTAAEYKAVVKFGLG
jgi:Uncharacterized conserved protein